MTCFKVCLVRVASLSDGSLTAHFGSFPGDSSAGYSYSATLAVNLGPGGKLRQIKQRGVVVFSRMGGRAKIGWHPRKIAAVKALMVRALAAKALGAGNAMFEVDL